MNSIAKILTEKPTIRQAINHYVLSEYHHTQVHRPAACNDLSARIATTDKEIDSRVYALYGLTEEEIKIVEA